MWIAAIEGSQLVISLVLVSGSWSFPSIKFDFSQEHPIIAHISIPAIANIAIQIAAPNDHTLNLSGVSPSPSFSCSWYQIYTYVYATLLINQHKDSRFIVLVETPAELPAVTAQANNGNASKPFAQHASAHAIRCRDCGVISKAFVVDGLVRLL